MAWKLLDVQRTGHQVQFQISLGTYKKQWIQSISTEIPSFPSGDLNAHHITFPCCTYTNASGSSLYSLMCDNDLHQLVTQPTRITADTKSCLDVILTNLPEMIHFKSVLPGIGTSDHGIAVANIGCNLQSISDPSSPPSSQPTFDYSNTNWQLLNSYFGQANWDQALHHPDINVTWSDFKDILDRGLRIHTRVMNRPNQPQRRPIRLNHSTLQIKREMQTAWNQHKTHSTPQTYSQYASKRNRYTQAVRAAKRAHDERIADQMSNSPNPKTWYKLCKRLYKGSAIRDSIPSLSTPEKIATTAPEKAAILNQTFVSKASNTPNKVMPPLQTQTTKCLDWIEITRSNVFNTLQQLDTTKAPGPDRIHNIVLKSCASSLCNPLTTLFQRSLSEGVLPSEWKLAEVTAIYKHKGNRNDPNNYRPISLTSSICKIMERIVNNALLKHLTTNNLITANQFGFLPKHSTTDQLAYLLHELHQSISQKKITIACFLDLAAAFDTVPHAAILHKLPSYGIRGHLLRWIANFLKDRNQFVSINGHHSPTSPVRSGVPQGSVVAPTLFIIFMNDLSTSITQHSSSISLVKPSDDQSNDHL